MSKKTLKFDNVEVSKKEFHASNRPIALDLVNVDQILIPDKFKHIDTCFKQFIGDKDDKSLERQTFMNYFTSNKWIYKIF